MTVSGPSDVRRVFFSNAAQVSGILFLSMEVFVDGSGWEGVYNILKASVQTS